ncbi:MAG: glycosyltransferase family 4 protein [Vicinamibacterales bacterium]
MTPAVLMLAGPVSPEHPSMNRYAQELFLALGRASDNSHVIALEQPAEKRYVSKIVDHRQARRIDGAWSRYVAYPRSMKGRTARVFHILDHGYAQLIRSLDPGRTVVTCHDVIPLLASRGVIPLDVPSTVARTFAMRVAQLAKARVVIAISQATRDTLERYTAVRADRVVVIPYGVNATFTYLAHARGPRQAAAGVKETSKVVLQVATKGRYKNTPVLLQAFAQLRARVADVVLLRIGAPLHPDEASLADRLGVLDSITHLGTVSDDQTLAEWYNAADVLVFPSLWEGFGWPPLEAMACGTPVVASDIPAIREVVGDAGILVSPADPSAVAVAVERVLTDTALSQSLRTRGLERAARFTWANTAARTLAVYNTLLQ